MYSSAGRRPGHGHGRIESTLAVTLADQSLLAVTKVQSGQQVYFIIYETGLRVN